MWKFQEEMWKFQKEIWKFQEEIWKFQEVIWKFQEVIQNNSGKKILKTFKKKSKKNQEEILKNHENSKILKFSGNSKCFPMFPNVFSSSFENPISPKNQTQIFTY